MSTEEQMRIHSEDRRDKNLKNVPEYFPMNLLNEEFAERNHSQTLTGLNKRGGLGILEILDNIHKRRLSMWNTEQKDVDELNQIISKNAQVPPSVLLSAEDFYKNKHGFIDYESVEAMQCYAVLFAKHHVREALKSACKNAIIEYDEFDGDRNVNKNYILNAYPEGRIK